MYNSRWFYLSLLLVACVCFCGSTTEFVVKKNDKRTPSASHMKEEICQNIADTLQQTAHIIGELAHVQGELLLISQDILNDNCLGSCTKKDLSVGHEHALKMYSQAQSIVEETRKFAQEVESLRTAITRE